MTVSRQNLGTGSNRPPRAQPVFRARACAWCTATFTPLAPREQRCEDCRQLTPAQAGRCEECGSIVSGRARWGAAWGGGCDRVEERISDLMDRLPAVIR
jgi:hypothetical protein